MSQQSLKPRNKVSKFLLIFGLVWLLVSGPFLLVGLNDFKVEKLYKEKGVKTEGTYTSRRISESRDSKNNKSTTYYISYKFKNEKGVEVESEDSVSRELHDNATEGLKLQIEYIPGEPERNRIFDSERNGNIAGYLFCGFSALCFLIGAGSLWFYFSSLIRMNRLLKSGTQTEGEIIYVAPGNVTINGVRQYQIKYSYSDSRGQKHEKLSEHMAPEVAQLWKDGDKCRVRFDRNKPTVSMIVL